MSVETIAMLRLSAFCMGGLQSPKAEAVSSYFLVLHGFAVSLRATAYANYGLERCVSKILEELCASDEQVLNPYISSPLPLEVSRLKTIV